WHAGLLYGCLLPVVPNIKNGIYQKGSVDVDGYICAAIAPEPGRLDVEVIAAHGQARKGVVTCIVANDCLQHTRIRIRGGDNCFRNNCAGGIPNSPGNSSRNRSK